MWFDQSSQDWSICTESDQQLIELTHKKRLGCAVAVANEYLKDEWKPYRRTLESLDIVRLCNLYLQTWVSRVARLRPDTHDLSLSQSWIKLWNALAKGIDKYYQYTLRKQETNHPAFSSGEVLRHDVEYASKCMFIINQWKEHMDFPEALTDALKLFTEAVTDAVDGVQEPGMRDDSGSVPVDS